MKQNRKMTGVAVAAAWAGLLLLAPSALRAETTVQATTFTVSATVTGVNTLTPQAKLIGTDANQSTVTFAAVSGAQSAWNKLTDQYIQIIVDDNAINWRLRAFTNNFSTFTSAISTTTWGLAYGGLKGDASGGGAKVAMGWRNSPIVLSTGPTKGNPTNSSTNGWTYFKDNHDKDDPDAVGDQSFVGSDAVGYTNIAFGTPSYTRIIIPESATGSTSLSTLTTAWNFYMEGDFSVSPAAAYTTNLVLELVNQ